MPNFASRFRAGSWLLAIGMLVGCSQAQPLTPIPPTPMQVTPSTTVTAMLSAPNVATTPTQPKLQLTFLSDLKYADHHRIVAVTVGCLDEKTPCLSAPETLWDSDLVILNFSWSPDGTQLALSAQVEGKGDIFVADANGLNPKNITQSPEFELSPIWSPDGNSIAYEACSQEEPCRIFSIKPNGMDRTELLRQADTSHVRRRPNAIAWAPNGRQIAFVDYEKSGARQHIYLSNLDGSGLIQLTDQPTDYFSPAFSPDGSWIAFIRDEKPEVASSSPRDIFLIRPNGADEAPLTRGLPRRQYSLAWSSLGKWIALSGGQIGEQYDVYLVSEDGEQLINVTESQPYDDVFPAWRLFTVP